MKPRAGEPAGAQPVPSQQFWGLTFRIPHPGCWHFLSTSSINAPTLDSSSESLVRVSFPDFCISMCRFSSWEREQAPFSSWFSFCFSSSILFCQGKAKTCKEQQTERTRQEHRESVVVHASRWTWGRHRDDPLSLHPLSIAHPLERGGG